MEAPKQNVWNELDRLAREGAWIAKGERYADLAHFTYLVTHGQTVPDDLQVRVASLIDTALANGGKIALKLKRGPKQNKDTIRRAYQVAKLRGDGMTIEAAAEKVAENTRNDWKSEKANYLKHRKQVEWILRSFERSKSWQESYIQLARLLLTFSHDDGRRFDVNDINETLEGLTSDLYAPVVEGIEQGSFRRSPSELQEIIERAKLAINSSD